VFARRTKLSAVLVVLSGIVYGCGSSQTGTVEGRVIVEEGPSSEYAINGRLELTSGSDVVASQGLSPTGTYRFIVAAGSYSFHSPSIRNCTGTTTVRSERTTHHDVICIPFPAVGEARSG
jgi:hypothetical protein